MKYHFSALASEDLTDIIEFGTERFGATRTAKYVGQLKKTIDVLARFPNLARLRDDLPIAVRIQPTGSHLIVYRIVNEEVVIVRLLHASSDIVEQLSDA